MYDYKILSTETNPVSMNMMFNTDTMKINRKILNTGTNWKSPYKQVNGTHKLFESPVLKYKNLHPLQVIWKLSHFRDVVVIYSYPRSGHSLPHDIMPTRSGRCQIFHCAQQPNRMSWVQHLK